MNLLKYITHPSQIPHRAFILISPLLSDKFYLTILSKKLLGGIDWNNPVTFNQKLQWLKLYDRRPEYTMMVDKYLAKEYVGNIIGKEHIVPLLGVWDNAKDIDFDSLPETFVLKCNHNSGSVWICKDKSTFDTEKARKEIQASLAFDYYKKVGREWPYKNVPRKVIAEAYLGDADHTAPNDYKVFCFNGEPKAIQVDVDRFQDHKRLIYTPNWEKMNLSVGSDAELDLTLSVPRPEQLESLLEFASILSKGIPHVRVDFYIYKDQVYFGELSFFHNNGFGQFHPAEKNEEWGRWIQLPEVTEESNK